jgi:uncharacterized protein YyaL (SSP411 family)
MEHTNKLVNESSPYLLQHAHNPVDWYPWGEEALQRAKTENKPILVSIGYAACHWCHVMERESFEDSTTADIMNKYFVNIKIDREERPDLDHIYMDAVQAMTGSGGWPLNVFLTPEKKPFYGGTYFPPQPMTNHPSWKDVLYGVASAYSERPHEIAAEADNLTQHLLKSNAFGQAATSNVELYNKNYADVVFSNVMKNADRKEGGFGRAPKFPQTFTIQYLLHYYHFTKNQQALEQACLSLDKMIYGGIYDQIGGGFSRYSTDARWLAPHFEKMLYDNALMLIVLAEAFQLTGNKHYERVMRQTIEFIEREMMSEESGFYSALDADSEEEEGKFYVWSKQEIEAVLGDDALLFNSFYDVSDNGNWEGKNILNIREEPAAFASRNGLTEEALWIRMYDCSAKLLARRSERIRPQLDDKILLGWNALMNIAYTKVYAALGDNDLKVKAVKNMRFMLDKFAGGASGNYFHTYKNSIAKYPAFLDDYAYFIQALIHLQEITGDVNYLLKASEIADYVLENFSDPEGELFFYTHKDQADIVIRKKEIYDGAVPSGNAIMAWNLLYLSIVFDRREWRQKVEEMLKPLLDAITKYPTSFAVWAGTLLRLIFGIHEIAILGDDEKLHKEILHIFIPNRVMQFSATENQQFPLLKGKTIQKKPLIFLCKDFVCQQPVDDIPSLIRALENRN